MGKIHESEKLVKESEATRIQEDTANRGESYYRNLIEASMDSLLMIGPDGVITDINSATENATGLSREEILGTDFSEYFTEPEKARIGFNQVLDSGKVLGYELYLKHINGTSIPVSYNASVFKKNEGQIIGVLAVARDVSAIKKYQGGLIDFGSNLEVSVQQKIEELIIVNTELAFQNEEKDKRAAELVLANKELIFQTGEKAARAAELVIANKELAFQNGEKDKREAELVLANKELIFQTGEKAARAAELVIANKELAFENEEKDKRAAELIIANEVLFSQNEEILYINHHDFLTGLFNRIYFEAEKKRLDTPSQLPLSVIVGDINGLKLINDGFGYAIGDELLIGISKILKSCCPEDAIISRIGGDEFGILLPQTDSDSVQHICSRISETCNGYVLQGSLIYPSISLGHATKNKSTEILDDIFLTAEEHMFRHKLFERKSVHNSILASIKVIMFEKSQETEEHAERMVLLSKSIGMTMSLSEEQLHELELLATLHDIGKMGVSAKILSKPDKLNDEEWVEMKKHPEIGFRIAQATSELIPIAEYILYHHERWDGKGYPQGLRGADIPLLSRIIALVDAFDAMTNDRVYRSAMTKKEAIKEIRRNAGSQFDPEISKIFIENVFEQEWEQVEVV